MGASCSSDDGQTGSLKPKRCPLTADLSASYHVQNAIDKLLLEPWEVEYIHNFWVSLPKLRKQEPKGGATGSKHKKQSKQADSKGKADSKSVLPNQKAKKGKKGKKQQEKKSKKAAKGADPARMETLTAHLEFVSHRAVARMLEIPLTPFAESCFLILDIEDKKRLHFRDFIVALWQFLTLDAPNLVEFAFDVFEAHIGALHIELEGLGRQVEEVFGSRISAASTKYIRELIEKAPGMPVTPQQFKLLCARDPAILQPALDMQVKLRRRSGTKLMWQNASVTRRQIRNNQNWKDLARQLMPGVKARKDSFPGRANVWPTKQDGDEVARVAAMVYQEPDVFKASDKPLQHGRRHSMQHFVLHTEDVQQPHFSTPGHLHDVRGMWRHAVGNDRAWLRSSTKPAQSYNQTRDLSTGVFSGLGARSHNAEYRRVTRKQIQEFNPHQSGATGLQFKAPGFEKLVQAEVEASGAFEGAQIQMQRPKGRRSSAIMPEFEAADVLDDLYS